MDADVQRKCLKCGKTFWLTTAEQTERKKKRRAQPIHCPACRAPKASAEMSSALATLEQLKAGPGDLLANLLPEPASLFKDILELMGKAAAPIEVRRRTFSEWIRGLDLQAMQIEKKLRAGDAAEQLLRQRLEQIRRLQEVARLGYEAVEADIAQRQKLLRGRLEELELEEKIAQMEALKTKRIETLQLEETSKHMRLLNEIRPATPPPVKPTDPVRQAIEDHRGHLRAKATAKQLVISDFLKELQKVFRANVEDSEKAARIRAVLEAYKQEEDALPKDIREFLENVEDGEAAGRE